MSTTLNLLAKLYDVPLILGEDGKATAVGIAVQKLLGTKKIGKNQLLIGQEVVEQIVRLIDSHELDGVLGGYEESGLDYAISLLEPTPIAGSQFANPIAVQILEDLIDRLATLPNDVGNPEPS